MTDLKLDTSSHDLVIEDNNLVLVEGADAVAQEVKVRLQFFLGEWFLDTRLGVPYFEKILGQKPRINALKGIFRKAIMSTPGMISMSDFSIAYDGASRVLSVSFTGQASSGTFDFTEELII
jgi:hypothetical protein